MDDQPRKDYVGERFLAQRLLTLSAGRTSAILDGYSGWLLAGFGGAIAFIVGNLDKLTKYLQVGAARHAVFLFLGAVVAGLFEKYLASIVAAGFATSESGAQFGAEDSALSLDFAVVMQEIEKATFYPARWIVRRNSRRAMQGDLATSGRLLLRVAQVQSLFLLLQVAFCVWSVALIGSGLTEVP